MSLFILHLLLRVCLFGQSFGPSCCSCVLSSSGVSGAAFFSLGLLSHPPLLLFLARVSSFGVCSDLGWKAAVLSWFLPSLGGSSPSLVLVVFAWRFQQLGCPSSLSFLELFAGVLSSRFVFADSSGWLSDCPWLSALRCLAAAGVTLVFCRACRLALVGLRCLWVTQSCGVHGLRDGVTCLRSGLCSFSVSDRNEDFTSFRGVWFLAFMRGTLPQAGAVFFDLR